MAGTANGPEIPDPTIDLHWDDYRGAIHEIFQSNAHHFPDRICVEESSWRTGNGRKFTYKTVNDSANILAQFLVTHGCRPGDVVMVYAYRGVDLVIAYIGALKAGAAVSVLDPLYPAERQKVLLEVACPTFIIQIRKAVEDTGTMPTIVREFIHTNLHLKAEIPLLELCDDGTLKGGPHNSNNMPGLTYEDCMCPFSELASSSPDVLVGPDSTPTLSFTSGSEGRPKAVMGRHFSLAYYFPWMADKFGLSAKDRFTMLSGIAHDPIQRDIFTPLFLGATLVVPHKESITHEILAEWMCHNKITVTHLTPAMGQILVGGATTQFPTLHHAFFVGDLLTRKDCRRLQDLAPNVRIVNMYGTTETQRAVSYFELPSKATNPNYLDCMPDVIPVGQGMLDVQLLVVDREDRNRICDVGEQGELFLRAGGLAEGYLGDDDTTLELNRSKFITNWFMDDTKWIDAYDVKAKGSPQPWMKFYKGPRDRLYRTGDLGHYRPDGFVECTGRIDNQVKIRGFRIELGDIDSNLSHHPFVRENVTTIRRNKDEEPTLVSYIVPEAKRWLQAQSTPATSELDPHLGSCDESMVVMINRYKALSESCKDFLRDRLPTYAIPAIIIPLARMPLNPNGKIDKPSLPFPDETDLSYLGRRMSKQSSSLSETQSTLARIWASILPNTSARILELGSNFFHEGGHSVLAQQMLFAVRKEWASIDIPMSTIFQSPTLGSFAAEIDRALDPTGLRLDSVPLDGKDVQDESYAADARDLLNSLPTQFASSSSPLDVAEPSVVFLTGATGFLGSYILRELLTKTKARVIAHVRCSDPADGLGRIERTCRAYGFWDSSWRDNETPRLEVVRGDISRERLGVEPADWSRLEASVDLIIHNGAQVNWMLPYSSLRSANVISTADCVQLCGRTKPKRLVFISSTSALDNDHYVRLSRDICNSGGTGINEADDLEGSRRGLTTGYGQTKWSSEYIIRQAGARGLHGTIVRSGYVTGEPETGLTITDDFLVRMWKGCLQVRCRPDISNTLNQVPVTQVARLAVAAGFHSLSIPMCVAHVTSHPRLTMNNWLGALEIYGYDVPQVSYQEWVSALKGYVGDIQSSEVHSLLPLFDMVTNNLPASSIAPELDDSNSTAILHQFGGTIKDHAVTHEHIGKYLAYLIAIGFFPPPRGNSGRPLPSCPIPLTDLSMLGGRGASGR